MSSYGNDLFAKQVVAAEKVQTTEVDCTKVEASGEVKAATVEATTAVECAKLGVGDKKDDPGAPDTNFTVAGTEPTPSHAVPADATTLADLAAAATAINANRAVLRGIVTQLHKTGVLKSTA